MQEDTDNHKLPPVGGQDNTVQADDTALSSAAPQPVADVQNTQQNDTTPPDIEVLPAEDVDLIEKVWVEKAKEIVQKTVGDPYKQNQELSQVKAAYIKKRYSKDIKVSE